MKKNILYLFLRYISFVMGMASFMLATIHLESGGNASVFMAAVSFSVGIYCGDTNTLTYYQSLFKENGEFDDKFYFVERAVVSSVVTIAAIALIPHLTFWPMIAGTALSFIFPQGRVSDRVTFEKTVLVGGIVKTAISMYIYKSDKYIVDPVYLICASVFSNYIGSFPFHIKLFFKNLSSTATKKKSIQNIKLLFKSFAFTLPIHFYTSLAPFVFVTLKGESMIGQYYLYDRLVRGLGATVLAVQASTTSHITASLNSLSNPGSWKKIYKFSFVYLILGFAVGILFYLFSPLLFNILHVDSGFSDNNFFGIFVLSTAAMYLSNYFGIQIFMTHGLLNQITLSSVFASFIFLISVQLFDNSLLIVSIPEISISLFQLGVFCAFLSKNKRKN